MLVQPDEGHTIVLTVTATNSSGSEQASSPPTAVVAPTLPVSTAAPQIRGGASAQQSVQLGITGADWQTPDATTYASSWQRCDSSGAGCQTIGGATGTVYAPGSADVGHTLVAIVTATNIDGSVAASSKPTSVVLPAAPRWKALPQLTNGVTQVGDIVSLTAGVWSGPAVTSQVTQLMHCFSTCTPVGPPGAGSYVIAAGDLGAILRVREIATNSGGTTVAWSVRYVGPISSMSSGSAVLGATVVALRNSDGDTLALAAYGAPVFQTAVASGRRTPVRTVAVRRARGVRGSLRAWACPVNSAPGGPPPSCSRAVVLRAGASLRLPAGSTGKVRVVVVRRRR